MNAANHYATLAIGLVAVGVQEQAEDILVPPLLRNCLTLNYFYCLGHFKNAYDDDDDDDDDGQCQQHNNTRLRRARRYPTIYALTNRYKNSFILFAVNHFQ